MPEQINTKRWIDLNSVQVAIVHKSALGRRYQDMDISDIPGHAVHGIQYPDCVILVNDSRFKALKNRYASYPNYTMPLDSMGDYLSRIALFQISIRSQDDKKE